MLVDRGRPERLGELVRHLVREHPETEVLTEAPSLATVPEGSTVVLCVRAIDADWLNQERPVVKARSLRLVLFSDEATTLQLAREAVDFYDWISHCIECPGGPPAFAVRALRRAALARTAAIVWQGGDLEGTFAEALPGRTLARVTADQSYAALLEPLRPRAKTWVEVTDLDTATAVQRIRWAEAEAGRRGRLLLVEPTNAPLQLPRVGARVLTIEEGAARLQAAGVEGTVRLAALLELSPQAIDDAVKLSRAGVGEAELARIALREADPGVALGLLAEKQRFEGATEAPSVNTELNTDARGLFHIPSWPARVELAYRAGDVEVASRWATGWRGAGGGARATAALARVLLFEPLIDEARALVLEARREAGDERDDEVRFELDRAEGFVRLLDGDWKSASQLLDQAARYAEKLDRDFIDQAEIYDELMESLISADRLDRAEQLMHAWTTKCSAHSALLNHALVIRPSVRLKIAQGDIKSAELLFNQWLISREGREQWNSGPVAQLGARILLSQKRFSEAELFLRRFITRQSPDRHRFKPLRQQYARALHGLGRFQEEEKVLRDLLADPPFKSTRLVAIWHALSGSIASQGRLEEAENLLSACLIELRESNLSESKTYTTILRDTARLHHAKGDLSGAEMLFREVLHREESLRGREDPTLLTTLQELIDTLMLLDKPREAEPLLRRAVRLSAQAGDMWVRAGALTMLAKVQAAQGFQHARGTARQSLEAWTATGEEAPPTQLRELEAIIAGGPFTPATSQGRRR